MCRISNPVHSVLTECTYTNTNSRLAGMMAGTAARIKKNLIFSGVSGGETGIRTLGPREGTTVFETAPFDHSGTSPRGLVRGV